jgi:spectinomycin phosphotransferase/16S rRNA (guanine(1405)-N(7))-methyltransferase
MRVSDGWVLIDWDTALLGPPERDLWWLDTGDGRMVEAYEGATDFAVDPAMLELYRIRWDLADLAVYVAGFHAVHRGDRNDEKSWQELSSLLGRIGSE